MKNIAKQILNCLGNVHLLVTYPRTPCARQFIPLFKNISWLPTNCQPGNKWNVLVAFKIKLWFVGLSSPLHSKLTENGALLYLSFEFSEFSSVSNQCKVLSKYCWPKKWLSTLNLFICTITKSHPQFCFLSICLSICHHPASSPHPAPRIIMFFTQTLNQFLSKEVHWLSYVINWKKKKNQLLIPAQTCIQTKLYF